uniref:Sulfatase N-terminal domain-containing protein n=1 Tax=Rhodosorus marinus TaxID=101924 RepID=A0A7S2ZJ10_9RHOD|mmetsp:Transcript_21271/g.86975  ORF Transcript_21271/g.86975 Transcript_21271/m.86975 type:complete len:570 (+) Transcript_21271:291-2000(+)
MSCWDKNRALWVWFGLLFWFAALGRLGEAFEGKPNVILILLDDLGYHDLGIQGSEDVKSPNIDGLARDGVRFTDGYASHSFCGPSRSGLLSGIHPFRIGTAFNAPKDYSDKTVGLPLDLEILPQTMKKAGYETYCVGKWHLGHTAGHHPKNRGFDGFFGFLGGRWNYTASREYNPVLDEYNYMYRGFRRVSDITYVTDDFTQAAVGYMHRANRVLKKPFFLYLAYNAPHAPYIAKTGDLDLSIAEDRRVHVGMITAVDRGVRRIRRTLEELGVTEETLIIFTNDNGGHAAGANNEPLNNFKSSYREGGLRVPWFLTWPGVVEKGQTIRKMVTHLDIYPTLQNLAHVPPEDRNPALAGVDLMPFIKKVGEDIRVNNGLPHSSIAFGGPDDEGVSRGVLREGPWKLLVTRDGVNPPLLYHLDADIRERTNLAALYPTKTARMLNDWRRWNSDNIPPVHARERAPNPLRLELSVVDNKLITSPGSPITFQATGSSTEGESVDYYWETFEPIRVDEANFRDVWTEGVTSTGQHQSSITITYPFAGDYIVRVNIETERWVLWKDVQIQVSLEPF